jgi:hypothetical protein
MEKIRYTLIKLYNCIKLYLENTINILILNIIIFQLYFIKIKNQTYQNG